MITVTTSYLISEVSQVVVTQITVYIAPIVAAVGNEVASNYLGAGVSYQNHW
jgi:hypothetical protein